MLTIFLAHLNASLDASSYILALGIVDVLTFGPPVHPEKENKENKEHKEHKEHKGGSIHSPNRSGSQASDQHDLERQKSQRNSLPSPKQPRRSASDPGWTNENDIRTTASSHTQKPLQRSSTSYDPEMKTGSKGIFTSWKQQRRVGSDDFQSNHVRRSSLHHSGSDHGLHHYQRKILSQQMQRTMRIQPYVRAAILMCLVAFWFFFSVFFTLSLRQGFKKASYTTTLMILRPIIFLWKLVCFYIQIGKSSMFTLPHDELLPSASSFHS